MAGGRCRAAGGSRLGRRPRSHRRRAPAGRRSGSLALSGAPGGAAQSRPAVAERRLGGSCSRLCCGSASLVGPAGVSPPQPGSSVTNAACKSPGGFLVDVPRAAATHCCPLRRAPAALLCVLCRWRRTSARRCAPASSPSTWCVDGRAVLCSAAPAVLRSPAAPCMPPGPAAACACPGLHATVRRQPLPVPAGQAAARHHLQEAGAARGQGDQEVCRQADGHQGGALALWLPLLPAAVAAATQRVYGIAVACTTPFSEGHSG